MLRRDRTIASNSRDTIVSAALQPSRWQYLRSRVIDAEKARRFLFDVRAFLLTIAFVLASALARLGLDQIAPDISPFTTFLSRRRAVRLLVGFAPSYSRSSLQHRCCMVGFSSSAMDFLYYS